VREVSNALNVPLSHHEFDALVDLAYNAGPKSVRRKREMMRAVNAGHVSESNFTAYDRIKVHGKLKLSKGLRKRRIREWLMYEKGEY